MTVPVQLPITTATANGVTVVFPYAFKIARDTDLVVTVNGLVRTLGTDYTLTGVGADVGGNVTFAAAPAAGAKVVLRRVMAFKRDTNYTNLGDLLASTLNGDQDDPIMMLQQLASTVLQMVETPDGEFVWDAQGMRLVNLGSGINPTDAANLGQVLTLIEQVVNGDTSAGGSLSVNPQLWTFIGDGVTTEIVLDSDVDNALFYDVAVAGLLQEPYDDYTITGVPGHLVLKFAAAPAAGAEGWVVLRGYARPYSGQQPILTVAPRVVTVFDDATLDGSYHNTLVLVDAGTPVTITLPANTGAPDTDWALGEFCSIMQKGLGKVTVAGAAGVTLVPSPGFTAQTRDQGSIVSATCYNANGNQWAVSGDLLRTSTVLEMQAFTLPCSDEAATNIAAASNVYRFRMPYAFLLADVRATLNVAQPSGTVLTVDVKKNGTSIFATKPSIDNAEFSSTTSSAPYVFAAAPNATVLGDGDLVSVDVTQVGAVGARGLKLQLIGQRTA